MKLVEDRPILAIDPGLRELGYAVLQGRRLLDWGVLPLRDVPPQRRPSEVDRAIQAWTRAYRPGTLVIEQTAQHGEGRLRPLRLLALRFNRLARRLRLKTAIYSAKTVRKAVVGNGWATKAEAARALCVSFPALRVCLTQDRKWKEGYWHNMFDAVALARYHQLLTNQPLSRSR